MPSNVRLHAHTRRSRTSVLIRRRCRGTSEEEAVGYDALLDARSRMLSNSYELLKALLTIVAVLGGMNLHPRELDSQLMLLVEHC